MTHLSSVANIMQMTLYSLLTYFIGPLITRPFMNDHPDQCVAGYLFGFTISIFLWMKYGRNYSK